MTSLKLIIDDYSDDEYDTIDNKDKSTLPWIEKYRPDKLDDMISHIEIIKTLKKFIFTKYFPHMLFYGPPGTGKTSTILACAKELYQNNYSVMVMELNAASDDRGIDVVRNKIKQFVSSDNAFCKMNLLDKGNDTFKLVILDEIDAMTCDAQAILRQVIEKYTNNARFCLVCNYIKKIDPALQSRCVQFRFAPLDRKQIMIRAKYIIKKEKVNITNNGLNTVITRAHGDMRRVLNTLQSASMIYNTIDEHNINTCFGYPNLNQMDEILTTCITMNLENGYNKLLYITQTYGISLSYIIVDTYNILMDYITSGTSYILCITKYSKKNAAKLLNLLRAIEYNMSINTSETIQISGYVSIFHML